MKTLISLAVFLVVAAVLWMAFSNITVVTPAINDDPDSLASAKLVFHDTQTNMPAIYTNVESSSGFVSKVGAVIFGMFTRCAPYEVKGRGFLTLNVGLDQYGAAECLSPDRIFTTSRDVISRDSTGRPSKIFAGQIIEVVGNTVEEDGQLGVRVGNSVHYADPVLLGLLGRAVYTGNCLSGEHVNNETVTARVYEGKSTDMLFVKGILLRVKKGCSNEIIY